MWRPDIEAGGRRGLVPSLKLPASAVRSFRCGRSPDGRTFHSGGTDMETGVQRQTAHRDGAGADRGVPREPIVEPRHKRRVLIFSATSGFRHKSIPHGKEALSLMGQTTGAYEAVVSDDPANFEPETLRGFDAHLLA